ncbi:MAG: VWA domain-containing protein [Candidatus Riflebacteria bacterium]|nr:VWA domain-containing protein [Candidatus Riflebacteria bacterium]
MIRPSFSNKLEDFFLEKLFKLVPVECRCSRELIFPIFSKTPVGHQNVTVRMKCEKIAECLNGNNGPGRGTNISDSLEAAFKALSKREGGKDRSAFIVFLTDGAPTAGVTEPEDILKSAKEWNAQKARVFVFGVGDTINTTLLDRLSEEHGGVSNYISDKEDIEVKVSRPGFCSGQGAAAAL